MIRIKAYILPLILICLCGCSLIGCLSIAVESEKAEETEMTFTRDGKKIYGKLYTPKGDGPFPAVILGHQFGANHSTMEGYAKAFARNGIMAYVFDFIGGGHDIKSDGVMEEMSVLTEAADMSTVLDGIRALDNVDKDNVFLTGSFLMIILKGRPRHLPMPSWLE